MTNLYWIIESCIEVYFMNMDEEFRLDISGGLYNSVNKLYLNVGRHEELSCDEYITHDIYSELPLN